MESVVLNRSLVFADFAILAFQEFQVTPCGEGYILSYNDDSGEKRRKFVTKSFYDKMMKDKVSAPAQNA